MLLSPLIVARVAVMIIFLVPQSPQSLDAHPRLPSGVVIHHIVQFTCVFLKIASRVIIIVSLWLFTSPWGFNKENMRDL